MLDLLAVGQKITRPVCHMQPRMRIACLPVGFASAARDAYGTDRQADGRTDGRTRHHLYTLTAYEVRVKRRTFATEIAFKRFKWNN